MSDLSAGSECRSSTRHIARLVSVCLFSLGRAVRFLIGTRAGFLTSCIVLGGILVLERIETFSPHVRLPQDFEFGPYTIGSDVTIRIPIQNAGLLPLHIGGIHSGCACIEHSLGKDTLYAGQETQLDLRYASRSKAPGLRREVLIIDSNDPGNPKAVIRLKIQLAGGWRPLPNELLVLASAGATASKSVFILDDNDAEEKPLSIKSNSDYVSAKLGRAQGFEETGKCLYEVDVRCDASFPGHEHLALLQFVVSDGKMPVAELPVVVRVAETHGVPAEEGAP